MQPRALSNDEQKKQMKQTDERRKNLKKRSRLESTLYALGADSATARKEEKKSQR